MGEVAAAKDGDEGCTQQVHFNSAREKRSVCKGAEKAPLNISTARRLECPRAVKTGRRNATLSATACRSGARLCSQEGREEFARLQASEECMSKVDGDVSDADELATYCGASLFPAERKHGCGKSPTLMHTHCCCTEKAQVNALDRTFVSVVKRVLSLNQCG